MSDIFQHLSEQVLNQSATEIQPLRLFRFAFHSDWNSPAPAELRRAQRKISGNLKNNRLPQTASHYTTPLVPPEKQQGKLAMPSLRQLSQFASKVEPLQPAQPTDLPAASAELEPTTSLVTPEEATTLVLGDHTNQPDITQAATDGSPTIGQTQQTFPELRVQPESIAADQLSGTGQASEQGQAGKQLAASFPLALPQTRDAAATNLAATQQPLVLAIPSPSTASAPTTYAETPDQPPTSLAHKQDRLSTLDQAVTLFPAEPWTQMTTRQEAIVPNETVSENSVRNPTSVSDPALSQASSTAPHLPNRVEQSAKESSQSITPTTPLMKDSAATVGRSIEQSVMRFADPMVREVKDRQLEQRPLSPTLQAAQQRQRTIAAQAAAPQQAGQQGETRQEAAPDAARQRQTAQAESLSQSEATLNSSTTQMEAPLQPQVDRGPDQSWDELAHAEQGRKNVDSTKNLDASVQHISPQIDISPGNRSIAPSAEMPTVAPLAHSETMVQQEIIVPTADPATHSQSVAMLSAPLVPLTMLPSAQVEAMLQPKAILERPEEVSPSPQREATTKPQPSAPILANPQRESLFVTLLAEQEHSVSAAEHNVQPKNVPELTEYVSRALPTVRPIETAAQPNVARPEHEARSGEHKSIHTTIDPAWNSSAILEDSAVESSAEARPKATTQGVSPQFTQPRSQDVYLPGLLANRQEQPTQVSPTTPHKETSVTTAALTEPLIGLTASVNQANASHYSATTAKAQSAANVQPQLVLFAPGHKPSPPGNTPLLPTIHVTIGRVIVQTPSDNAKPTSPPRQLPQPALSLDAYLQRQQREAL